MKLTHDERQMIASSLTHFADAWYSWTDVPETMTPVQARYALDALKRAEPAIGAME